MCVWRKLPVTCHNMGETDLSARSGSEKGRGWEQEWEREKGREKNVWGETAPTLPPIMNIQLVSATKLFVVLGTHRILIIQLACMSFF